MKKAHFLSNPVDYRIYDRKQRSGQRGQVMQKTKQIADNTESSPGWARTTDTRINSPLLCQLSYKGVCLLNFSESSAPNETFHSRRDSVDPPKVHPTIYFQRQMLPNLLTYRKFTCKRGALQGWFLPKNSQSLAFQIYVPIPSAA